MSMAIHSMHRLRLSLPEILAAVTGLSVGLAITLFTPLRFRDFASFLCAAALLVLLLRGAMARRRALRYFCQGASFPQAVLLCYSLLKIQRLLPRFSQGAVVFAPKASPPIQQNVPFELWLHLGRPHEYQTRVWMAVALGAVAGAAWLFCRTYWEAATTGHQTGIDRYARLGFREVIFVVTVAVLIFCARYAFEPPLWVWPPLPTSDF